MHGGKLRRVVAQSENFVETVNHNIWRGYQAERDHTPQWGISFTTGAQEPPKIVP